MALRATEADPNTVGREKMTPLIYAVLKQDPAAIKGLLAVGADPVLLVPGVGSAADIATQTDDTRALVTLLDNGTDARALVGGDPFSWSAARAENYPALKVLFAHGLSIDARNTRTQTLLIDVLRANDTEMANWLVDHGADVRAMDRLFNSAPGHVQYFLDTKAPNNSKLPGFRELKAKFEQRGVRFPVPTVVELKQRFGRAGVTVEEAVKLNERGETSDAH